MSGTLPPEWEALTDLEALTLRYNSLVGPIPTTYGNMKNLRDLWINHNFMQGEVPSELGKLKGTLRKLLLEGNGKPFVVFAVRLTPTMP